jgi:hypothetical protein
MNYIDNENTLILLETNLGAMKILLYDTLTPGTVENFLNRGWYPLNQVNARKATATSC